MGAWQPISTALKDGTRIKVTHSKAAKGYDGTAVWDASKQQWSCSVAFIANNMRLYWQPDLWQPLSPEPTKTGE